MNLEERISELLGQLTLEEKVTLTVGGGAYTTAAVERLGIPAIYLCDGPHGVRKQLVDQIAGLDEAAPATCFPTASALGSSWDTALAAEVGSAIAAECLALDVQVLLGPGVNMKRTPLCGRNFEYYAEDPVLAGEMGAAFVSGVQSRGVGTSLKHYACNNQEHERLTISAEIDLRTMREIYLPAFERVVKNAQPWTVMAAYNKVNGVDAAENPELLNGILRGEWGYDGLVVSDWGAVTSRDKALAAGLDLEMPATWGYGNDRIAALVQSEELPLAVLDRAVSRVLRVVLQGAAHRRPGTTFDEAAHHALARRAAAESMVLLKNEGSILPLDPKANVAVIGRFAKQPRYQGGGSSHMNPTRIDVPYDELCALLGVNAPYAAGYPETDTFDEQLIDEAVALARRAGVAVIFAGLPDAYESEAYDRKHLSLPPAQIRLIEQVTAVQQRTVVVLANGSAVTMDWADGPAAILEGWLGGQASGGAVADVLLGRVNPSGHLAETFPVRLEDTPAYLHYPGEEDRVRYGEGLFIGYRYYDTAKVRPLFAFGHGLSYTTFAYRNLRLSREQITDRELLDVTVAVTNTGARPGKAVVQLYVKPLAAKLTRPEKELKAFAKVELEPGQTRDVTLRLEGRDFAAYSVQRGDWVVDSGDFALLIGEASDKILLTAAVTVTSTAPRLPFDKYMPIARILADPGARQILLTALADTPLAAVVDSSYAMYLQSLPLVKLPALFGGAVTQAQIDGILEQINAHRAD
jgi:beta-glucosidase